MDEKKILVDVWQFLQGIPGHADNYALVRLLAIFWNMMTIICLRIDELFKPPLKIGTANAICWNSLGLFRDYGLNHIFFRNKTFLFFKIESWNFQHLFEKEFCETSQNFNSIRQRIEKVEIKIVWMSWMSWNFVRFHEIPIQTDAETFSFLSWKTKRFYS